MPFTINGVGTSYVGKKNLESYQGRCESCGREVMLRNYQTRLCFVVLFVPVIPLRRKQIIADCSACRRHRAIPIAEWQRIQETAIQAEAEKLASNQDDPLSAVSMLETLIAFHKTDEANRFAEIMLGKYPRSAAAQLAVAGWYEKSGKPELAASCIRKAFELEPDNPAARYPYASLTISEGKLNEARELLRPLEFPSPTYHQGVFFQLARAFAAREQHQEALDLYRLLHKADPGITKYGDFRSAVRKTEKALETEESLVPSTPLYRRPVVIGAAAAAAVIAALVFYNAHIARNRDLYVVNGLHVPISVEIDGGEPLEVDPRSHTSIRIAEGNHQAKLLEPQKLAAEPFAFTMETGWFARFFREPAFVLDPAASAEVVWLETIYSEDPDTDLTEEDRASLGREFRLGERFVTFPNVHIFFEEFPEEIEIDPREKARRSRVDFTRDPATAVVDHPPDQVLPFLERHLALAPDDSQLLNLYTQQAVKGHRDRGLRFLEANLDARPIMLNAHTAYQDLAGRGSDGAELVQRYDGYLQAEPNDPTLLSLRAHLAPGVTESLALLDRALKQNRSLTSAWRHKALCHLARAEFAKAADAWQYGRDERLADEERYSALYEAVSLAASLHNEFEAGPREALKTNPLDFDSFRKLAVSSVIRNDAAAAQSAMDQMLALARSQLENAEFHEQYSLMLRASLAVIRGDWKEAQKSVEHVPSQEFREHLQFEAQLHSGDLVAAEKSLEAILERDSEDMAQEELSLAVALKAAGEDEKATLWKARAVEWLRGHARTAPLAALCERKSDEPLTIEEALDVKAMPDKKALCLLCAIDGPQPPSAEILDLIDKLNFDLVPPHYLIKTRVEQLRQKTPQQEQAAK